MLGPRKEFRLGEVVGNFIGSVISPFLLASLKNYRPIQAETVAKVIVEKAKHPDAGFYILEFRYSEPGRFNSLMLDKIKSIYIWVAIALLFIIWYPLVGLFYLLDRDPAKYNTGRFFRFLGAAMTYVNPAWKIKVMGKFPENPRNPYVIVCNHLSNADIPIISRLPWEMKWIAKLELFKLPVVGRMMTWAGDIPVDRSAKGKREKTIFIAQDYLKKKCSVIFFPEGTRSKTGRVIRFTDGAFILAVRNKIPILPLVIDGTSNALPKHSWVFTGESNVKLKVLEPIETEHLTKEDIPVLRDQVRSIIIKELAQWRGVSVDEVDDILYQEKMGLTESTQTENQKTS